MHSHVSTIMTWCVLCANLRESVRHALGSSQALSASLCPLQADRFDLPHKANVKRFFSRAGNLSDPNMDPHFLAALTRIAINRNVYEPTV